MWCQACGARKPTAVPAIVEPLAAPVAAPSAQSGAAAEPAVPQDSAQAADAPAVAVIAKLLESGSFQDGDPAVSFRPSRPRWPRRASSRTLPVSYTHLRAHETSAHP
eukprot:5133066-Alexandrium_andersonii.AAC.1